jgi:hypothetical protein
MNHLIIADSLIHQDTEGRYCLNDLHLAAGGDQKHKPANFMRLDSTIALVAEIECCSEVSITPVKSVKGNHANGAKQGTYVCKELVYAYAMWISPKFHLQVIRAYDAMVTGRHREQDALEQVLLRVDRLCGILEKLIETLPAILAAQKPKVRRPPIYEKDLPAILALRDRGATLPDIARATGFGQTSLYYVLEGKYTIAPGGRIKRVADASDKVSALVRREGQADGLMLVVPVGSVKRD